jgi:hypothetical protein
MKRISFWAGKIVFENKGHKEINSVIYLNIITYWPEILIFQRSCKE